MRFENIYIYIEHIVFPKKVNYLQPLETGSTIEESRTELPDRFAQKAQGGHGPNCNRTASATERIFPSASGGAFP